MDTHTELHTEIVDVLQRIERITVQIELHTQQDVVDSLSVEGYERLREQYFRQLEELLASLNIRADIHLQAA